MRVSALVMMGNIAPQERVAIRQHKAPLVYVELNMMKLPLVRVVNPMKC